jgi:uncharacterized membrane protein
MTPKAQRACTICVSIFGIAFALLLPPFQSPDEPNHFLRAYQVSEGRFFPEKKSESGFYRLGGTLPLSLAQACDSFAFLKNDYAARLSPQHLSKAFAAPLQPEQRAFLDFANTAIYAPTAYLPQAAAIALLRPLGASPLQMLYAARLANLLIWWLLVLASIRILPFGQWVFAALALLPASLVMAASTNADVLTNGLCAWFVAAALARKWVLVRAFAFAAACANKLIVWPLGVLTLGMRKPRSWPFASLLVGLFAALIWGAWASDWFVPWDAYALAFRHTQTLNAGVDPARQWAFVAENPVFFLKIASKSALNAAPSTAAHFVGKFGWEKNYLPAGWLFLLWAALAGLLFSEKNPLSLCQRALLMGLVLAYCLGFALTMYALWCPVGAPTLSNWQGRYFVPIAPVLAFALLNGRGARWRAPFAWVAVATFFGGNVAMLWAIWERYWAV